MRKPFPFLDVIKKVVGQNFVNSRYRPKFNVTESKLMHSAYSCENSNVDKEYHFEIGMANRLNV